MAKIALGSLASDKVKQNVQLCAEVATGGHCTLSSYLLSWLQAEH